MNDFRWLIEAPGTKYLAVRRIKTMADFVWTSDHNTALAFRTKEQADDLMMAVRDLKPDIFGFERTLGNAAPVEHAWMGGPDQDR
jgi:hypothetical protein